MLSYKQQLSWIGYGFGIVGLVFLLYWRALSLSFAQDDWVFLQRIVAADSSTAWLQLFWQNDHFYRPVPRVFMLGLQYRLFGLNAMWFHGVHLLLHAINAVLIGLLGARLTSSMLLGMVAGVLYALHQALYLSIIWVSGIQELMLVLGVVVALQYVISFIEHGGRWRYGLALGAGAWALLSKDAAVILPLWVVMLSFVKRHDWRQALRDSSGFVAIVIGYLMLRSLKAGVDAQSGSYKLSFDFLTIAKNLQLYTADFFAMRLREDFLVLGPLWVGLFLLLCSASLWWLPDDRPFISLCLGFIATGLGPVLLLVTQNYSYYLALSLFGCVWLFSLIMLRGSNWLAQKTQLHWLKYPLIACLLVLISLQHQQQRNLRWHNDEGGIRYKSLLSDVALEQFYSQPALTAQVTHLEVRNTNTDMYWAWGQGHMFQAIAPQLKIVRIDAVDPITESTALEPHQAVFELVITEEMVEKAYEIRPAQPTQ